MRKEVVYQILEILLHQEDYILLADIAKVVGVSSKTISNYLNSSMMSQLLKGVQIDRRQNVGIKIVGTTKQLGELERQLYYFNSQKDLLEVQGNDDISYILNIILNSKEPITIRFLSDKLYRNPSSIRDDLDIIGNYLAKYEITTEIKTNVGIRIIGKERDIREAYYDFVMLATTQTQERSECLLIINQQTKNKLTKLFPKIGIDNVIDSIKYSEEVLNNQYTDIDKYSFLVKLLILISRSLIGYELIDSNNAMLNTKEYFAAQIIKVNIETKFLIELNAHEASEITGFILSCRKQHYEMNIDEVIDQSLAKEFLNRVGDLLDREFHEDEVLYSNLMIHLRSAMRRLRYGMRSENPLIRQIRYEYPDVYIAVLTSIEELEVEKGISFDIDEIGYICMHIVAAMHRENDTSTIETCLISDGGLTVQLYLKSILNSKVPQISITSTITSSEVSGGTFKNNELVLNASRLDTTKHSNAVTISQFIDERDIVKINHLLLQRKTLTVTKTLSTPLLDSIELFSDDLLNQEEVLIKYGNYLFDKSYVDKEFINSVFEREQRASTLVGKGIAVPHGLQQFVKRSSIIIVKLNQPIQWGEEQVDMVFLLAMNLDYEKESKQVFRRLYQIIADTNKMKQLKEAENIESIKQLFRDDIIEEDFKVNIAEMINEESIEMELYADNKKDGIRKLAEVLYNNGALSNLNKYVEAVYLREDEFSTGIGYGFAIPHARSEYVRRPSIAIAKLKNEISYASFDDEPVRVMIMLAVPNDDVTDYMKVLSSISRKLMHEDFRKGILEASTKTEILNLFQ